jgi:hypothetical protein
MGGPDGWFSYDITYPAPGINDPGIEHARLYLYIAGTTDLYSSIDLTKGPDGSDLLPDGNSYSAKGIVKLRPGYYRMAIQITNGAHAAGITEIVHIYSNMETKTKYDASDAGLKRIQLAGKIPIEGDVKALSALTLNFYTDADHTPAKLKYSVPVYIDAVNKGAWRLLLRPSTTGEVTLYPQLIAEYIDWNTTPLLVNLRELTYSGTSQTGVTLSKVDETAEYKVELGENSAVTLRGNVKFTGEGAARLATYTLYIELSETPEERQAYPPKWRSMAAINGYPTGSGQAGVWAGSFEVVVPKSNTGLYAAIDFGPYYHHLPLAKPLPRNQDATLYLAAGDNADFGNEGNTIDLPLVTLGGTVTVTPPEGWSLTGANVAVNLYADPGRTVFVAHADTATTQAWSVKLPPTTGSAIQLYPVVLVNGLVNTASQHDDSDRYSGWLRFVPNETVAYGSADTPAALTVNMGSTAPVLAGLKVTVDTDGLSTLGDIAVTAYADAVLSYPIGDMEFVQIVEQKQVWKLSDVYLIPGQKVWIDVQLILANGLTIHSAGEKLVNAVTLDPPVDLGTITFGGADTNPAVRLCGDGAESADRFLLLNVPSSGTYTMTAGLPKKNDGTAYILPYIPGWLGIDPEMVLYDKNGNEIARNDDEQLTNNGPYTNEARITQRFSPGNYFVGVSDRYHYSGVNSYRFSYRIEP